MFLDNPGVTAVAVLSLALGIAANTTIFSVINTILLRPFPVEDPDRLIVLYETNRKRGGWRIPTAATHLEWKKHSQFVEDIALTDISGGPSTLSGLSQAQRVNLSYNSPNFFSVLGVRPFRGRTFLPEDAPWGDGTTVVISYSLWQRSFEGDPDIVGREVAIEDHKKTIVGVMPPGFSAVPSRRKVDVWMAWTARNPSIRWLQPIGRLRRDATIEQAQAEMDTFARRLEQEHPETNEGWGVGVETLHEYTVGGYRRVLYLLLGAVGFVLLIACINVANLTLARATARQKEMAVRASLGARRLRLLRQLLTESLLLALLGGVLGMLLAFWGIWIFVALAPTWFARTAEISIDATVLGFTLGIALFTGILFGLAPALKASKPDLNESLKETQRPSAGRSRHTGRNLLVVAEIGLALVLLVGAGLMINSFLRLQGVDPGFDPNNVLTAEFLLGGPKYFQQLEGNTKRVTPQGVIFFQQVLERLRALPGVVSASVSHMAPPGFTPFHTFRIAGPSAQPPGRPLGAGYSEVSPDFFHTLRIPLLKGRYLSERDVEGSPWVVVINETMARRIFPDEDPIGRLLHVKIRGGSSVLTVEEDRPREIVGVVGDVRQWGPRGDPPPIMYGSYRQHVTDYPGGGYTVHLRKDLLIRTVSDPMSLAGTVSKIVAQVDKDQAVFGIKSVEQDLSDSLATQRFWMRLFGIFAGLAVILAAVGIYGVMSYVVSRRTHEIGVRMAMGAKRGDVLKLVVGQGLKLTLIGVAIGIAGGLAMTRLVRSFLYEVKPTDPLTFAAVSLVLAAVALAACYIPARRATKVDPMVALRHE
jgi:putative ABC transport system permease protein